MTIFSAPNYCGEFDNAGAMMSVDDTLMCSFQVCKTAEPEDDLCLCLGERRDAVVGKMALQVSCSAEYMQ